MDLDKQVRNLTTMCEALIARHLVSSAAIQILLEAQPSDDVKRLMDQTLATRVENLLALQDDRPTSEAFRAAMAHQTNTYRSALKLPGK